jgi:D-aspartate ligase
MRGMPPAVLLGGNQGTAISVARSLGKAGVPVYLLADSRAPERYSRYCTYLPIPREQNAAEAWAEFLLGPESDDLRGSALLACSDAGIELLLGHREALLKKYLLDISDRDVQARFLNKLATYELAAAAGIPTPRYWRAESLEEVHAHEAEYPYPLLVKPLLSHRFAAVFSQKFLVAQDFDELLRHYEAVRLYGVEVLLLEKIPGPDDRLCSYFTYMDEAGTPLLHYTKRVIRRYPENEGLGCYHVSHWDPAVCDLGLRLFTHAGLRGLGNVEFKRDDRDGRLKIIEVNARFTAANGLLAASGYDLAPLVYGRVTGRPTPLLLGKKYAQGLHMWHPGRDCMAFLELRRSRGLTFGSWASSLLHRQVFPYFRWDDPLPTLMSLVNGPRRLAGLLRRLAGPGRRARIRDAAPPRHATTDVHSS